MPVPGGCTPKLPRSPGTGLMSERGSCSAIPTVPELPGLPTATPVSERLPWHCQGHPRSARARPLSKTTFCLIRKAGKAINGSGPGFRKWIKAVNRSCLPNEVLLPAG